jgi:hypothetical protein
MADKFSINKETAASHNKQDHHVDVLQSTQLMDSHAKHAQLDIDLLPKMEIEPAN